MNITISNAKSETFSAIFQNIRAFTEHVSIIFSKTGVYLQTMDSARVSIIELKIPHTWFEGFEFTHTGDIVLGINTNILFKILNARDKLQKIHIIWESADILSIHFTSDDKTIFDKFFQCPLVDLETESMNIPAMDYAAEFSLQSSVFSVLMNQLKSFGDSLDIECTEENIRLSANSMESGKMSVEVKIDDLSAFTINEGEELNLSFSLTQLHAIAAFNKIAKEVSIGLCTNYPMSVLYRFSEDGGELRAFLAPKISADD